jgi:hypothetical protein
VWQRAPATGLVRGVNCSIVARDVLTADVIDRILPAAS